MRFSLSTSIMAAVLGFSLVMLGVLTWRTQTGSSQAGRDMAVKMLSLAGDHIQLETELFSRPILQLREFLAYVPEAKARVDSFDHPMRDAFLDAMDSIPHLYSLYFAYPDGEFYQGISFRKRPGLYKELKAPPEAMYGIRYITRTDDGFMQAWRFYDDERKVVGQTGLVKAEYDPRTRDWYKGAMAKPGGYRTDPYVFTSLKNLGVTMSRVIPGPEPVVLGLGVTLASLSDFVAEQRMGASGLVQLFSVSGQLIAYPDPSKLIREEKGPDGKIKLTTVKVKEVGDPLATAIENAFEAGGKKPMPATGLSVGGVDYMVQVMPIPILGAEGEYVALAVPATEFIGPLEKAQRQGLILVGVLMALAVPVMLFASHILAKPLRQLTNDAARLSELDMTASAALSSSITEVDSLCRAMNVMRANFEVFGRYLPRSLMRHIHDGAMATLGGQRREITLLFTDVEDFTVLSERMDPELLMHTMSDYFQGVTKAILDSGGTIDKFIGDAVMAFWNAPGLDEQHIERACAAALRLQEATDRFNAERLEKNEPVLRTRVGIHTGEAVVGNIGTDERMDYTALGSVVNLTARLEGLNKYYGTRIMVSKRVRDAVAASFLFRSTDVVAPKGVADAQATFELVAAKPGSAFSDVAASSATLGYTSRWERAMMLYRTKEWPRAFEEFSAMAKARPEDGMARRYVHWVKRLLESGDTDDWTAAKRFTEK